MSSQEQSLTREGQVLREALGAPAGRRPRAAPPSWQTPAMAALALLGLVSLVALGRDLWRPKPMVDSGYTLRELRVQADLPTPLPEGASLSVMLLDVPATLTRPVSQLEALGEGSFRMVWRGELARVPQRVRGRLQAPGWEPVESSEVSPEVEEGSVSVTLPTLQLRRPKGR